MPRTKLTTAEAAAKVGVKPGTWRDYVSKGKAPKADGRYDERTPWWWSTTVNRYIAARPGRGARTDMHK